MEKMQRADSVRVCSVFVFLVVIPAGNLRFRLHSIGRTALALPIWEKCKELSPGPSPIATDQLLPHPRPITLEPEGQGFSPANNRRAEGATALPKARLSSVAVALVVAVVVAVVVALAVALAVALFSATPESPPNTSSNFRFATQAAILAPTPAN